jgi:hypothetical protein
MNNKQNRPKLRQFSTSCSNYVLERLNTPEQLENLIISTFLLSKYYKLIDIEFGIVEDNFVREITSARITVEKLQNLKSYYERQTK